MRYRSKLIVATLLLSLTGCFQSPIRDESKIEVTPAVVGTLRGIADSHYAVQCDAQGWPDEPVCNATAGVIAKLAYGLRNEEGVRHAN